MKSNIILIGMPGCGKSTIGEKLAQRLNYDFRDLDDYIVEKENMTIDEMFKRGEDYFRDIESSGVRDIASWNKTVISTGGGVVKRPENTEVLKQNGFIVFIDRPIENIIADVDTDTRPLLKEGRERLYDLLEERYELYKECCNAEIINDSDIDKLIEKLTEIIPLDN